MGTSYGKSSFATVTPKTGDAVGLQQKKWFVAIVTNNTEKKCSEKLLKMGYEAYVPTQRETHRWASTGKDTIIDRIVLPSLVFIHVTESERKEIVSLSFIHKFMTNKANRVDAFNRHPIATIPNKQIETLKFMLYNSDEPVEITGHSFHIGDKVRIVRGSMRGLVGNILNQDDKLYILVGLDILGYAKTKINITDIEHI